MKRKILAAIILFQLALMSCSSVQEVITPTSTTTSKAGDYYNLNITPRGIYQKPQVADLDVNAVRVKASFVYEDVSNNEAKNLAKGDFLKQQKCDVIVEPMLYLTRETKDNKTTVSVTISGFAANYENIRNYEPADSIYFIHYRNMPW